MRRQHAAQVFRRGAGVDDLQAARRRLARAQPIALTRRAQEDARGGVDRSAAGRRQHGGLEQHLGQVGDREARARERGGDLGQRQLGRARRRRFDAHHQRHRIADGERLDEAPDHRPPPRVLLRMIQIVGDA
jgi:hypothetical protein